MMQTIFPTDKLQAYEKQFKYHELPMDKETIRTLGLIKREIYAEVGGKRYSVNLRKASMTGIEIGIRIPDREAGKLLEGTEIQVNFSFMGLRNMLIPVSFAVSYTISGAASTLKVSEGSYILYLNNTHRPPGYLIGTFGELIQAKMNESKRKEERISINSSSIRKLGIKSRDTHITFNGTKLECVLKDISFSGSQIVLTNDALPARKEGTLELIFRDPDMFFEITGTVVRRQPLAGNGSTYSLGLYFREDLVPENFKTRLHAAFE